MNGLAQFAQVFSTLIFFPLLVRAFGTAEYGVYVIAVSVASMTQMLDLGVGASTVRLVAQRLSSRDVTGFSRVVSSSAMLLALIGIAVAGLMFAVGYAAGWLFSVTEEQAVLLQTLLWVGAAMQVWYWPSSVAAHVLHGLERYDLAARTSVFSTLANVGSIGLVLYLDAGPVVLMALGALVMVAGSLLNIATLWAIGPTRRLVCPPSGVVAQEIIASGMPVFMNSVAQFLNREQVDRIVIGVALGPAVVAIYDVAAKLSMLIGQVAVLPTSAVLPVVARAVARGDDRALRALFLRGGRYITFAIVPLVVVLAVLAGPFIDVWFGAEFGESILVAQLLILGQLLYPPLLMGDPILTASGRLGSWIPRSYAIAAVNLGLSIALVRPLGPAGVACATLLSSLVELPLYARLMLRETGVTLSAWLRFTWAGYLPLPLTGLAAAVMAWLLPPNFMGIAVSGIVALVLYAVCVWALVLSEGERASFLLRARSLAGRPGPI